MDYGLPLESLAVSLRQPAVADGRLRFLRKGARPTPRATARTCFCTAPATNFILLNLFPYTTGHSMVIPYAHSASLEAVDPAALAEMMELAQRLQAALRTAINPEGYNLGMNQGKCAGAGVADHLHLHILPRWTGDSSFMTTVGETRILPEDLLVTYDALAPYFPPSPSAQGGSRDVARASRPLSQGRPAPGGACLRTKTVRTYAAPAICHSERRLHETLAHHWA